jgi:Domain of unknown function (DUF6647)
MEALLTAIVVWLSTNFGLPKTFEHPRIEHVPSVNMAALRVKRSPLSGRRPGTIAPPKAQLSKIREVLAVYDDQAKVIYLSDTWSGRTAADLSVLVHEMVHHLQSSASLIYDCTAAREKLAYQAQDKWLGLFGVSLESEFQIDALTLLVTTSCG